MAVPSPQGDRKTVHSIISIFMLNMLTLTAVLINFLVFLISNLMYSTIVFFFYNKILWQCFLSVFCDQEPFNNNCICCWWKISAWKWFHHCGCTHRQSLSKGNNTAKCKYPQTTCNQTPLGLEVVSTIQRCPSIVWWSWTNITESGPRSSMWGPEKCPPMGGVCLWSQSILLSWAKLPSATLALSVHSLSVHWWEVSVWERLKITVVLWAWLER